MSTLTQLRASLHRLLAAAGVLLVLALSVFAASPTAHEWLHESGHAADHDHGHAEPSEDGCAVVLFASGVSLPAAPAALTPPLTIEGGVSPVTAAEVYLIAPRYLRHPERGPPAHLVS